MRPWLSLEEKEVGVRGDRVRDPPGDWLWVLYKSPWASRGSVSTMGRLELIVVGLAYCLAAVSAAKVSERAGGGYIRRHRRS